ncbi:hypothetical protein DMJ13_13240 [halophilic archaeon]|nr:hypothetical protein DMJ13_13240 [halophilic archaeon]
MLPDGDLTDRRRFADRRVALSARPTDRRPVAPAESGSSSPSDAVLRFARVEGTCKPLSATRRDLTVA